MTTSKVCLFSNADFLCHSGDDVSTERELPPLIVGPQFGNRLFLSDCYTHLHGGVCFEFETPDLTAPGAVADGAEAPAAAAAAAAAAAEDTRASPSARKTSSARSGRLSFAGLHGRRQPTPLGDAPADGESTLGALAPDAEREREKAGRPLLTEAIREQLQTLTRKLLARMVSMSQSAAASLTAPQQTSATASTSASAFKSPQRATTASSSAALKRAFQQQSEQFKAPTIELGNGKTCACASLLTR